MRALCIARARVSLAGATEDLIENPEGRKTAPQGDASGKRPEDHDVLSDILRAIRLTGSLQFCFMPEGDWETDDKPAFSNGGPGGVSIVPFHIVAAGDCWIDLEGRRTLLQTGDVVAFPFASGHKLGAGDGGRLISPSSLLPPKPWRDIPRIHYGSDERKLRLLCGYLRCDAMNFRPLQHALPKVLHVRSHSDDGAAWLRAAVDQLVEEVDRPRGGGLFLVERLSEVIFIELLRHQMLAAKAAPTGWLAALADPAVGRCLGLIHADPGRDWTLQSLATAAGLSRSVLAERFEAMLAVSPIRYIRDWRLFLASMALSSTSRPISAIASEAGYGTEAAFSRAFSRSYGAPPAAWRRDVRRGEL